MNSQGMIGTADQDLTAGNLLEVTFQAEIGVAHREHFGVHRAVGGMADRAPFPGSLVFENVRPALVGMTAKTIFVFR